MDEVHEARQAVDINPDAPALSDLRGRLVFRPDDRQRLPLDRLGQVVKDEQDRELAAVALELSARRPYAAAGYADFYNPGRWDCATDLVYMSSIVQLGGPGEWEGTVGYAQFTSPAVGGYIVVVNFSGWEQTMSLNGPWGRTTARSAAGEPAAATALWNGAAGQTLYCSFTSRSDTGYAGIAFLDSFQIFKSA